MGNATNKRLTLKVIFLYILVLSLFFVNEDILIFGTIDNSFFIKLRYAIQISTFLILLIACLMSGKIKNNNSLRFFGFSCALILISMLLNFDFRLGYFFMIMIMASAFLLFQLFSFDRVLDAFYKIMTFVSLFSLVVFAIRLLRLPILYQVPEITNIAGYPFRFFIFSNAPVWQDNFVRNFGPFREPGVFQLFVSVALIYGVFKKNDSNVFRIVIFFAAIATTFSTTGYIALFMILLGLLFKKGYKKHVKVLLLLASFAAFIYLAFVADVIFGTGYGSVFGKFSAGVNSSSYRSRLASITINLEIFSSNPFFGRGLSYVESSFPSMYQSLYGYRSIDNANTLFIQFARFGLVYGLLFVYALFRVSFSYFESRNKLSSFLIFATLVVLLFGENLSYSFIVFFLFIGASTLEKVRYYEKKDIGGVYSANQCCSN